MTQVFIFITNETFDGSNQVREVFPFADYVPGRIEAEYDAQVVGDSDKRPVVRDKKIIGYLEVHRVNR